MPKINNTGVRNLRREQAEKRQNVYDALSLDQKIDRAKERPGESSRELVRLYKLKLGVSDPLVLKAHSSARETPEHFTPGDDLP